MGVGVGVGWCSGVFGRGLNVLPQTAQLLANRRFHLLGGAKGGRAETDTTGQLPLLHHTDLAIPTDLHRLAVVPRVLEVLALVELQSTPTEAGGICVLGGLDAMSEAQLKRWSHLSALIAKQSPKSSYKLLYPFSFLNSFN